MILKFARQNLDIFGQPVNIHVYGESKMKTTLTLALSIFAMISSIVISIIFVVNFFKNKEINVVYTENNTYSKLDLTKTPIMFGVFDAFARPVESNGTYSIVLTHMNYFAEDVNGDGKLVNKNKRETLKLEPCDRKKHFTDIREDLLENVAFNQYQCLPYNNKTILSGIFGNIYKGFEIMQVSIVKCNKENSVCHDEKEIEKRLTNVYLSMGTLNNYFDHQNYTHPKQPTFETNTLSMDYNLNRRHIIELKPITYKTDYGIVFNDMKSIDTYNIDKTSVDIITNIGNHRQVVGLLSIRLSKAAGVYTRTFMKLQQLFADIGGFIKGIFIIGQVLSKISLKNKLPSLIYEEETDLFDNFNHNEIEVNNNNNNNKNKNTSINETKNINFPNPDIRNKRTQDIVRNNFMENNIFPNSFDKSPASRKLEKSKAEFSICERFCIKRCLTKKYRDDLLRKTQSLIIKEISLEYMLRVFNEFNYFKSSISKLETSINNPNTINESNSHNLFRNNNLMVNNNSNRNHYQGNRPILSIMKASKNDSKKMI